MGDPIPGPLDALRDWYQLPSRVDIIILSRPCKLSKFMTAPERSKRGRARRKDKEAESVE